MNWSVLERKGYGHTTELQRKNFKMHVWYHYSLHDFLAYGISALGVFTGSFHAQYARKVLGSFGCRRVASIHRLTDIVHSYLLTIHSDKTSRTLQKVSK